MATETEGPITAPEIQDIVQSVDGRFSNIDKTLEILHTEIKQLQDKIDRRFNKLGNDLGNSFVVVAQRFERLEKNQAWMQGSLNLICDHLGIEREQ